MFKTTITKKTSTAIITALILISAVALAMHTNLVKAQTPEPIMYASPAVESFTTTIPPTSPITWNFSIMVANLSQTYGYGITVIACSVKSADPSRAIIIDSFPGAGFASKGFTNFMNGSWTPSTGDLTDLTASQTGNGAMITTSPIEIFKIEVNITGFTPGSVVIDIYDQQAYDVQASQMLQGDCPYDQTVNIAVGNQFEPIMYASPAVESFTTTIPPTSPITWNFSIMVANLSQTYGYGITVIACSVKSADPSRAIIIDSFPGADFASNGFTNFMNGSWTPSTGDLTDLTASQTGNGAMITTSPIEIFKIEVNITGFTPGSVVIDIYNQQAYDSQASQMLQGDCPYDQTVNIVNTVSTIQIVRDSTVYNVTILSNSTISNMIFDNYAKSLNFTTSGPDGTTGYFNVTIPKALLDCPGGLAEWVILMDHLPYTESAILTQNSTHTFIYVAYSQGTHDVQIVGTAIPEYPTVAILVTLLTMMTVALALLRKVHKKQWKTL